MVALPNTYSKVDSKERSNQNREKINQITVNLVGAEGRQGETNRDYGYSFASSKEQSI